MIPGTDHFYNNVEEKAVGIVAAWIEEMGLAG